MSSESKKQNPKPAAGEHRAITRLKAAAEEASKKDQVESESVASDVAEIPQQQHTQGLTFKQADAFFPAVGEQKEPSEGDGESSESSEEASSGSVQDDESQAAEENPSKRESSSQPAKLSGSSEVDPSVARSPKDLKYWVHFSDSRELRDEMKRVQLILDILAKAKVDRVGLLQVYDTYKKWHSKGLDLALFIQQLQVFNCGKSVKSKLNPLDEKYIEQVVQARNNLNEHLQLIKSYAQGLSVHDFTVLDFKGFLDLVYQIFDKVEVKPPLQDLCVMKLDGLLLKTSLGSAQYDGRPPAARFPPTPLSTMSAQRKGVMFHRANHEPILSKFLRTKKSASSHTSMASQRPVSYAFGEEETNHFFRLRVDFIRQMLTDPTKVDQVYDQELLEELYEVLASLNVTSTIPPDYIRAVQLLLELELTINVVVELILDELEIKSTFPLASAAKDHVQRLRQGKLLDYGTPPGPITLFNGAVD